MSLSPKGKLLRATLAVLATILLGALGSGLWESLLGPGLRTLGRWLLDLMALIVRGYKSSIYERIATDSQWTTASESLFLITLIFLLLGFVALSRFFNTTNELRSSIRKFADWAREQGLSLTAASQPASSRVTASLEEIENRIRDTLRSDQEHLRKLRRDQGMMILAVLLLCTSRLETYIRLEYVNSAITHYHQVMRIASVFLRPEERLQVESDFAQIANRDDYVRVVSALEKACADHGTKFPKFNPW